LGNVLQERPKSFAFLLSGLLSDWCRRRLFVVMFMILLTASFSLRDFVNCIISSIQIILKRNQFQMFLCKIHYKNYISSQEKSFLLPILLTITTPPGWGVVFFFFFFGLGVVGSSSGSSCSSDSSSRFWMQCSAFSKWPISLTEMQIESYGQWEHHQYNKMKGLYRLLYQYQDWWPTWPLTRWREPRRSKPRCSIPDENENWFINY
jgi:hypothetical protein